MKKQKKRDIGLLFKSLFTDGSTRVKFFFVLLSVFLWLLIKLSKDGYIATVSFEVEYINVPASFTFRELPPGKINVHLRAQGFNILKYKLRNFKTLKVDVSRLESGNLSDSSSYWLTNNNLTFFENQFEENINVLSLSPDTIPFHFVKLTEKKVPIELKLNKQFSKLINIYKQPKLQPDSITVRGPSHLLAGIDIIPTEVLKLDAEEETLSVKIPLKLPLDKKLKFSENSTTVNIRFTRMTQGSFEIPIQIIQLPEKYSIKIFPESVKLTYHVAVEDYSKVTPADFQIYGNAGILAEKSDARYINLVLESYPAFVDYVNFEPKRVEFILTEK